MPDPESNTLNTPRYKAPMAVSLILASSSPYRKAQLSQLVGENYLCISPDVNEQPHKNESPHELVLRLAELKARTVAPHAPDNALIIGGDQCAALDDKILGKPLTEEKAIKQLKICQDKDVVFFSGLCVYNKATNNIQSACVSTIVRFRSLSSDEIRAYIRKDQPLNCAGSFKCESLGIALFESIKSDDPSALVGLPLIQLNLMLMKFGFNTLTHKH